MFQENINYKILSYDELIYIIQKCQKELYRRGTITHCYNVYYTGIERVILITGSNKKEITG